MEQMIGLVMRSTLIIFIVAFGAHMYARVLVNKGAMKKARTFAWVAFLASLLLVMIYAASLVLAFSFGSLVMVALWGYFTWVDWQLIQQLGGKRRR